MPMINRLNAVRRVLRHRSITMLLAWLSGSALGTPAFAATLDDALDGPGLNWTTDGNAPWFAQNTNNRNQVVGSQALNFTSGTHNWETVSATYTVPAAYYRVAFRFTFQKTAGTAWFDNAFLILVP